MPLVCESKRLLLLVQSHIADQLIEARGAINLHTPRIRHFRFTARPQGCFLPLLQAIKEKEARLW